ncbi:MAG: GNAT family N-acetyltransferase [Chloroflexi bacterium]|nr:MAG: GNAT family N-acetyltransferase [Chloroflexota bacterium]
MHAARDRGRDGHRIDAAFERLGSDHDPRRGALGHAGMIWRSLNVVRSVHLNSNEVTLSTSPDAACTARVPTQIAPEWSAIAKRRAPSSVFLTPEWIAVARAHDRGEQITVAAGDPPWAVAALARDADGTVRLAGGELTDEHDVVAAPQDARAAASAVARWIAADAPRRVLVDYVPEDSPTPVTFDEELAACGYAVRRERLVTSPRMALPGAYDAYVQGLGKKERHELRRKLRRFEGARGTGFHWAEDGERARILDRFFALHRLSKGEKAAFMTNETEAFFRDIADALAPLGWLRLGVVRAHDQDAAVLFAFAYGDTLALYNAAYDPALASLSLGIASHAFAVRDAIAQGFKVYDLLRGDEPYKYDLGAQDRWLVRVEATRQ